jgi:recombination protein RecT
VAQQLAARVAERRGGNGAGGGQDAPATLAAQIERMASEYQRAMPKGLEATQLVRDGLTCLRTIRNLDKCEPASVLGALMTTAQLGLRPGLLGHAWPLPFWDGQAGCYKAQLVIGYQGYVELGYRSGKITAITARTVYEEDQFSLVFRQGADELVHEPAIRGLPGEMLSFYSTARLINDGYTVTRPMSLESMLAYREKHAPRNRDKELFGPWLDDLEAMAHKTMVKINFKLLPKSAEMAIAMEADEGIRIDLNPEANAAEVTERTNVVPGRVEPDDLPPETSE